MTHTKSLQAAVWRRSINPARNGCLPLLDLGLDVTKLGCFTNLVVLHNTTLHEDLHVTSHAQRQKQKSSPLLHFVFPSHVASREDQSLQVQSSSLLTEALGLGVNDVGCFADVMGFIHIWSLHERNSERRPGFAMYLAVWQSPPVPSFSTKINICCSRECPTCPGSLTSRRQSNQMLRQRGDLPSPSLHEDPHPLINLVGLRKEATAALE